VIGSGPAGLCAAAQLNRGGHWVTVFERADRPGGLLTYGIPNMKLDKEKVVMRRIKVLEQEGIKFVCDCEVGKTLPAQQLLDEFDAVVLCTGATKPRDLPVEGRQLKGIHFAMDFLTANTKSLLDGHRNGDFISAAGKDVIIIGGGDTGTDCVGTSMRHGCRSLAQIESCRSRPWNARRTIPGRNGRRFIASITVRRKRRRCLAMIRAFISRRPSGSSAMSTGTSKEIHTVQIQWERNEKGQFVPNEVPGTGKVLPAQLVLLAMGFLGPEQPLLDALGVERDPRTNIKADYGKYQTSIPKVFAAGDCRRGQSLVVWAFNEGRGAARECDRYLMGNTNLP